MFMRYHFKYIFKLLSLRKKIYTQESIFSIVANQLIIFLKNVLYEMIHLTLFICTREFKFNKSFF